jgi:hypothetical protein
VVGTTIVLLTSISNAMTVQSDCCLKKRQNLGALTSAVAAHELVGRTASARMHAPAFVIVIACIAASSAGAQQGASSSTAASSGRIFRYRRRWRVASRLMSH